MFGMISALIENIKNTSRTFRMLQCLTVLIFFTLSSKVHAIELTIESSELSTQIFEVAADQKNLLGVTPLVLNRDSFHGKVFLAEKTGFVTAYMALYENPKSKTQVRFTLKKIDDWLPEEMNARIQISSEELVDQVYQAQSLIEDQKFKEALVSLENLKARFPHSISIRILYANAVFLTGDSVRASQIYQSLLDEIPESRKTLREQILNLKARFKNERNPATTESKKGSP